MILILARLAADVHLVDLHDAAQDGEIVPASLANAMQEEPRRFLRHADFLPELKAGDTLAGRHEKVHGVQPLVKRDVRTLENRGRADGEVQLAGVATVEAALPGRDPLRLLAVRAGCPVRPAAAFDV